MNSKTKFFFLSVSAVDVPPFISSTPFSEKKPVLLSGFFSFKGGIFIRKRVSCDKIDRRQLIKSRSRSRNKTASGGDVLKKR